MEIPRLTPDLTDKLAVVTGASRGIGRAIATDLAACGAHVVLAARSEPDLESLRTEIEAGGGRATVVPTDIGDENSLRSLFSQADRLEDPAHLDIVVNNAGIGLYGDVIDFPLEQLDRMIAVNLRGTFAACQEAMKRMVPAQRGYILNVSSVVGLKGYDRQAGYTATKHGIVGITKALAIEAQAHGIRVSAICPGGVDTELAAVARPDLDRSILMKPEDISRVALFLLGVPEHAAIDCVYIRRSGSKPW